MKNFRQLNQEECDDVWDNFYRLFHFQPSTTNFPAITTNRPQLKLNINNYLTKKYGDAQLEEYALSLFLSVSKKGDKFYALDWQHECYEFDPRAPMDRNEFGEWIIPVLPNGDYYIFLTRDFNNVWFGHPWEKVITLIGEEIVTQGQKLISDFLG